MGGGASLTAQWTASAAHPGGPGDGGRLPVIRKTPRLGTTTLQTTVCEATAIDDQSAARFRRLTRCGRSCARAQSPMASPAPMAAAAQGSGEAVQAASTTSPSDAPTWSCYQRCGYSEELWTAPPVCQSAASCNAPRPHNGCHTRVSHLGRAAAAREQQAVGLPEAVVA